VRLQDIVDDLAARTGRGIDVEDRRFRLLAYSAHTGDLDDVRRDTILRRQASPEVAAWLTAEGVHRAEGVLRIAPNPDVGGWARACVPVRDGTVLLGFVWVLDEPPLTPDELRAITGALPELAPALARRRREEDAGREAEAAAVAALLDPGADAPGRANAARELRGLGVRDGPAAAVALLPAEGSADLLDAIRRRLPARAAAAWPAGGVLLAVGVAPLVLTEAVAGELRRADEAADAVADGRARADAADVVADGHPRADPPGRVAGVGDPAAALEDAADSAGQAALAAWTATRLRAAGPVALHAGLGPLALLSRIARDHPETARQAEAAALRAIRSAPDGAELAATLLAFLDAGGDAARAAERLGVHRATLYRRLRRAEALGGIDMADGRRRLELHNALLLAALRP